MQIKKVVIGNATLYCGDCMDVLPFVDKVDALITDPPYGINVCNRSDGGVGSISSKSKVYGRVAWDKTPIPKEMLLNLILKANVSIVWGGNYFELPPSQCWLVWDKCQKGFTFADGELAWTNMNKAVRIFKLSRGELVAEGKVHPTQKPVPLMKWCIEKCKLEKGSTIFDPYMGSGTTGCAAHQCGMKFIGVEKDPEYFEIACKRIRDIQCNWSDIPEDKKTGFFF